MPILADEREINTALDLAASRPFEGVDPGFVDRFKADFMAMHEAKNSSARETLVSDIQSEFIARAREVGGLQIQPWIVPNVGVLAPMRLTLDADREAAARGTFDAWKKQNPSSLLSFPSADEIEKEAESRASGRLKASEGLSRRSTGAGSAIGGVFGSIAGAMADPINAASVMFGASAASGILRTAMIEGAISMGSEAAVQGLNYDWRQRIDPGYSLGDAASEVAAAGVGGAVFGGGLKGLAAVWQRAKTGQWPSHVRDTANVVSREAAIPNSRFESTIKGDTAHRAAAIKSLDDIVQGRPVELPPETFLEANARPGRVYDADGRSVGVRYEVVDASDLITSHSDDLGINPDFPQQLQPRDRTRAMSQDQIAGIAANLQPERLGFSTDAASGAPIVGPDGLVESGNGRVLALRRAFQQDGPQANSYRNYLRSQNFDIEGMRNPVLIARRVTDLEDRVAFVTAANRSTSMRLGAAEQALSDARMLDGDILSRIADSNLTSADNQQFVRDFMSKLPRAEQGNLIDKDGFLSQEGQRRITSALMGRAYGEPVLLSRALEDTDNNVRTIAGAMSDSSGSWAKMRDAVARGEIPAGMDITPDLMNAVRLVMKARDEGRAMRDLVNQAEMFGGPDELSKIVARAMFSDADLKRPVGRAKLAALLNDFADEAMKNEAGPRLFGDALDAPDILKSSLARIGRQDLATATPQAIEVEKTMTQRFVSAGASMREAKAQSALYGAFYRVVPERSGKTADEFLRMYPLPEVVAGQGAVSSAARQYAQFAGVQAKTADTSALDRALISIADGVDPATVQKETGWFLGPDGVMKFEISDKAATLKGNFEQSIVNASSHEDYLKKRSIFSASSTINLGDLLEHPDLFKAYPDLRDIAVTTFERNASGKLMQAMFADSKAGRFVSINKRWWNLPGVTDEARRSALLHEVQHLVQVREGWANGATGSGGYDNYRNNFGESEARATEARRDMSLEDRRSSPIKYDVEQQKMLFPEIKEWAKKYEPAAVDAARSRNAEKERVSAAASTEDEIAAISASVERNIGGLIDAAQADGRYNVVDEPDYFGPILAAEYLNDAAKFRSFWGDNLHDFMRSASALQYSQSNKGLIHFTDGQAVISLFESADASTIVHESGHFFLSIMQDMIKSGDRSVSANMTALNEWWRLNGSSVIADGQTAFPGARITQEDIEKYLDTGSSGHSLTDKAIDTGLHEQFAKGFEAYLIEGRAPSEALKGLFDKFREWLSDVYRKLTGLDVELDNGVRGVFDRMLASDAEIGRSSHLGRIADERLTPEAVDALIDDPAVREAAVMDGERLIADTEPRRVMVDIGDGHGERDLADIMREADDEIAAANEIEACTIGKVAEE